MSLTLFVTGCGGSDAAQEPETSTTAAPEPAQDDQPDTVTTEAPESAEPSTASGIEGTGTATIGDTTWEFSIADGGMCDPDVNDAGVAFTVIMYGTDDDGRQVALNMSGPASGGEAQVQVGSPTLEFERWTADTAVYSRLANIEGMPEGVGAQVEVDGNTVSGSGRFYDDKKLNDVRPTGDPYDAGVLDGTFSATCPAK
jgi:hypothetical protein